MSKPSVRVRLTDRGIAALKPGDKRTIVFDSVVPGFCIRITERGHRSFVVVTRFEKQQRWITLGTVGVLGLAEARELARETIFKARKGIDPKPRYTKDNTFPTIAEKFVNEYARPRNRSWREKQRQLHVYCSRWEVKDISAITRRDVRELLDRVASEHGGIMANRLLSTLHKLFSWTYEREIIVLNPAAGVKRPAPENSRDRVLSDAELRAFWTAAEHLESPWGPFYRVLCLTGQRRGEVAGMRWQDVDFNRALWTLSREQTKSDRLHEVPLSPPALDIIAAMPRFSSPYVFTCGSHKHIAGFKRPKEIIDAAMPKGAANWNAHDLRRTFATVSARLGIAPHVVEKVLNHSSGTLRGVAAVYNRYGYDREKRFCLDVWASHLIGLNSDNITAIDARQNSEVMCST